MELDKLHGQRKTNCKNWGYFNSSNFSFTAGKNPKQTNLTKITALKYFAFSPAFHVEVQNNGDSFNVSQILSLNANSYIRKWENPHPLCFSFCKRARLCWGSLQIKSWKNDYLFELLLHLLIPIQTPGWCMLKRHSLPSET